MRLIAAVALCTACGRFDFDAHSDASALPNDTGISTAQCPVTPPVGAGATVVSTPAELVAAVASAAPGTVIALTPGRYVLAAVLDVTTQGVMIRSTTGNPADVVIDGNRTIAPLLTLRGSDQSLVSVTLTGSYDEGMFIEPTATADITNVRVYDVTFLDNAGPGVRVRSTAGLATGPFADGGAIECSRFVHTVGSPCMATFGARIDAARDWLVRASYFEGNCAEPYIRALWAGYGARDVTVADNVFLDNGNNIAFGGDVPSRVYPDPLPAGCSGTPVMWGGIICNNRIAGMRPRPQATEDFDEGIAVWSACDTWVLHNTVVSPPDAETWTQLEYRFAGTYVHLFNNLLREQPLLREMAIADPGSATTLYASEAEFVDALAGDLRLAASATVQRGVAIPALQHCMTDAAGRPRPLTSPMPGAYEP